MMSSEEIDLARERLAVAKTRLEDARCRPAHLETTLAECERRGDIEGIDAALTELATYVGIESAAETHAGILDRLVRKAEADLAQYEREKDAREAERRRSASIARCGSAHGDEVWSANGPPPSALPGVPVNPLYSDGFGGDTRLPGRRTMFDK